MYNDYSGEGDKSQPLNINIMVLLQKFNAIENDNSYFPA